MHIPNCRQYPAVYYGVVMAGAVFSPTNPLLPAADLAAQLTDAGARVLVTWDQVLPLVRSALAATPVQNVVVTGESHTLDLGARLELEPATSTSPTCSPATPPTGTSTPTSTRPRTWRTWPTPAAPRG